MVVQKSASQISYYNVYKYNSVSSLNKIGQMHGVKRVLVFCVMTAILPTILIITPLYLRHVVFADVTYPVAESDVLSIVDGVSSIFCESHSLRMNTSFNAFQMKSNPKLSSKRKHIRLKKSMTLPDDTLEYWGFYLLKGALVQLKVCSRYEGSRILVVRGDKDLKTCGLLDHNIKKYGAEMDVEHNRVKVTFENRAEEIVHIDSNTAAEELDFVPNKLTKKEDNTPKRKHHKRHLKKKILEKKQQIKKLEKYLNNEDDKVLKKRSVANLDAHIKHGGNNYNFSKRTEDSSVSSFEMDLLMCYTGQILLTESFPPSALCNDVHFLERGNHMMTEHEVASNGYYYYIFYSDNDLVQNDMHAIFDIHKPTYRYANNSNDNECINQTVCKFDISFMSDEIVIVEVPTRDGIEHEEDDITLLISTCHPRMTVYIVFPIAVLFLILGCAFV